MAREDGQNFRFVLVPPIEANLDEGKLPLVGSPSKGVAGARGGRHLNPTRAKWHAGGITGKGGTVL